MIGPNKGVPAQTFTLRNSSGKDVQFSGWKLAEVDSYNPEARDPATNLATGSIRWKERAVYQTQGGKIVCHKLGRSQVPGEVDRGEVLVVKVDTAIGADLLSYDDPRDAPEPVEKQVERQVSNFFAGDSLAKDLLDELKIEDVEVID